MILLVLIALAARVDASPADDAHAATSDGIAEAIRYANILTGDDPDERGAADLDENEGEDEEDEDGREHSDCDADCDDADDAGIADGRNTDGGNTDARNLDARNLADRNLDDRNLDARNLDARNLDGGNLDGRSPDDRADGRVTDDRIAGGGDDNAHNADDHDADGGDGEDDGRPDSVALAADDDGPNRIASFEDMSSDLAGGALAGHVAGELALLDAGSADAGAAGGDDVSFAAASAGAAETYESWMRHQRPSPWGRLDLGVAWRQRWSEPLSGMSRRYDEVWLVATWRR